MMTFSYFTNHHHCFRPFDTYPDKAGDTTGPCEKWYKGADYLFFRFISLLYFIYSFILCPILDFNFNLETTKIPLF